MPASAPLQCNCRLTARGLFVSKAKPTLMFQTRKSKCYFGSLAPIILNCFYFSKNRSNEHTEKITAIGLISVKGN